MTTEITGLDFPSFDDRQIKEILNVLFVKYPSLVQTLTNKTIIGSFTGDIIGNITGDQVGERTDVKTSYAANADLNDADFPTQFIELDGTGATVNITKWTPTPGKLYVLTCKNAANAVTVTLSTGGTWEGTNDTATFDAALESLIVYAISATRVLIVENIGAVAFS